MPFSDNLYSMVDDDSDTEPIGRPEEQPENDEHWDQSVTGDGADYEAFSPTDGYFHSASTAPASSNVPHVPNVWVRDPSLEQGSASDSKAREAHQEALANDHHPLNSPGVSRLQPSTSSSDDHSTYTYPYQPAHRSSTSNSSRATHYQPSVAAYTPSTTASYTSDAPRRQGSNRRSPFLPQDAPPAYTPSPTTSPTSSPSQTTWPRNYQTFLQPNMGREEAQGLLAHNPESMGGPDGELRGIMPAWSERARRRHPYLNGRNCRVMLLGLALLAITIGFLVSSITSVRNEKAKHPSSEDPPAANRPDVGQPDADRPDTSPILEPPRMDYPSVDGDHSWPSDHFCKDLKFQQPSRSFDLSFGQRNSFTFIQDVQKDENYNGRDIKVSGDLVLRRSGDGTPGPSVVLEVTTNDENIIPKVGFSTDEQVLHVTVPRQLSWGESSTWPCMKIQATVWVPADGTLNELFVGNVHLGIKLLDNLSLQVGKKAQLTTVVGSVVAAQSSGPDMPLEGSSPAYFKFDSRWIQVKTTSADIKGYWPLYDYLGLHSTSGKIRAGIEPKEADKDEPKPAVLSLKSLSGNIDFHEPVEKALAAAASQQSQAQAVAAPETWIPPRDYKSNIYTTSGDIKGLLAVSSTSRFHSTSGDMNIQLLPVLDKSLAEFDDYASLETSSTSGKIATYVNDPMWIETSQGVFASPHVTKGSAMRCLKARHTTTSGNINVHYPVAWEGDLELNTLSGKLKASGKDLKKIKEGSDWPGVNKQLLARKGAEGGSYALMKTLSGNIDVTVD